MRATATLVGSLLRGSSPAMLKAAEAAAISTKLPAAAASACYHSSSTACAGDPLGRGSMDGRVSGAADDTRQTGDTYYATPSYSNTNPDQNSSDDASAAALAASRRTHPSGPADTSSVNDPAGKAEGGEALGKEASQHVHHPGRPDAVGARSYSTDAKGGGVARGSHAGEGAGADRDLRGEEFDFVEGGKSGGIGGAWRAMTADFAAGGDDMTGGGTAGTVADDASLNASVNPNSGLPEMQSVDDAGAAAGGFGQQRDPGSAKEEGGDMEARLVKGSDTSDVPADLSSS